LVRTPASLRHQPATSEIYTLSLHDALPICSLDGHHRTLIKRRLGLQVLNDDQPTLPAQPDPVVHLKPGGKLSESRDGQCSALADFPPSGQSQSFEGCSRLAIHQHAKPDRHSVTHRFSEVPHTWFRKIEGGHGSPILWVIGQHNGGKAGLVGAYVR